MSDLYEICERELYFSGIWECIFDIELWNLTDTFSYVPDLLQDPFDSFGNLPNLIEESEAQTRGEILAKGNRKSYFLSCIKVL